MQNRSFKPGLSGHDPLEPGARLHLSQTAPVMRHCLKLGALGAAAIPAQPPHPLRQFLAACMPAPAGLPERAELRALILETAEAA